MNSIAKFDLQRAVEGLFALDVDGDHLIVDTEDLVALRALIDQLLPRGEHNHAAQDPDAHVIFDSVCCGAQLYRCGSAIEHTDLPSKPLIHHGEGSCRECGSQLVAF